MILVWRPFPMYPHPRPVARRPARLPRVTPFSRVPPPTGGSQLRVILVWRPFPVARRLHGRLSVAPFIRVPPPTGGGQPPPRAITPFRRLSVYPHPRAVARRLHGRLPRFAVLPCTPTHGQREPPGAGVAGSRRASQGQGVPGDGRKRSKERSKRIPEKSTFWALGHEMADNGRDGHFTNIFAMVFSVTSVSRNLQPRPGAPKSTPRGAPPDKGAAGI